MRMHNQSKIRTVLACPLTTNLRRAAAPENVVLDPGEGELSQPNVVLVAQLLAIDKSQLDAYIGSLSSERIREILDRIRLVIEP